MAYKTASTGATRVRSLADTHNADTASKADKTAHRGDAFGDGLEVDLALLLHARFYGSELAEADETEPLPDPVNGNTGGLVAQVGSAGPLVLTALTIAGTDADDLLHGTDNGETILGNDSDGWAALAVDDDVIYGHGGNDIIIGGFGDDMLDGGEGDDEVYGGFGNDVINGREGHDLLNGGGGNDVIYNDSGFDTLLGEHGNDSLFGGTDADRLHGGAHDDYIEGGDGNDHIWGDDYPGTNPGNDTISGGAGDDVIDGHLGDDLLAGGDGDDSLYGGPGDDRLYGGAGNDLLVDAWSTPGFASGNDIMDGGVGDDILLGRGGSNLMTGGDGADIFAAAVGPLSLNADFSFNTITDYNAAEGDIVQGFSAQTVGSSTYVYSDSNALLFVLIDHDMATDGLTLVWS